MIVTGKLRLAGILATAAICVPMLAACGTASSEKSNVDLIKAAVTNMNGVKSFHIKLDAALDGQQVTSEGDIDATNDKAKLNMNAAGQKIDVIAIQKASYLSTDQGKTFTKSPAGGGIDLTSFTKLWKDAKPDDIDKAKDGLKDASPREEKIGDVTTRHITASCKDTPSLCGGASSGMQDGNLDLWVSNDATPYVYKMKVVGKDKDQKETNATFEWSKFNEAVKIDAPPQP